MASSQHHPDAGTVATVVSTSLAVLAVMWRSCRWLWKRALKQAWRETVDDLAAMRETVEAHIEDDKRDTEDRKQAISEIKHTQEKTLEGLGELKEMVTRLATKQEVTANDVRWLKRERENGK